MNDVVIKEHDLDLERLVQPPISETFGKTVDIFSLKSVEQSDYLNSARANHEAISKLLEGREITNLDCPVCGGTCSKEPVVVIHGGKYLQCGECTHLHVGNGLTEEELSEHYKESQKYAATYTNPEKAQLRVNQVATPKAEWMLKVYRDLHGNILQDPNVLDVGAGGGYFVKACLDMNLQVEGIELSRPSISFAKNVFNIELSNRDFLGVSADEVKNPRLITFWGVIEHVKDPVAMLKKANDLLKDEPGMVVASVPNFRSGSTIIQMMYPDTAVRHIGPIEHGNIFTEKSISRSFEKASITPTHAWYFGMDAYEIWTQLVTCGRVKSQDFSVDGFMSDFDRIRESLGIAGGVSQEVRGLVTKLTSLKDSGDFSEALDLLPKLQLAFDEERASDEITLAGIPSSEQM